ncbi:MAG: chaperonin GroES [Tenuifilum sp.]|uniref:Co-chaperone GroES n=1 Tax=Tenuifilum thalassicum TaxID=2590900 RepID=A0A7D4BIJ1_9BACT|nr:MULTISPECIES: co-chaperone GroES family protein [Tenuifilum]MDI3527088.1 chaperonin GroES [Tenuifilum sp.]QKG78819.1 co-chaperone GroES [Tenuifilum thalassicum]
MSLTFDPKDFDSIIVVGDRLLIKPKNPDERTKTGLLLPPGVQEKQKAHSGYVVKVGPGYPLPMLNETDEPWKKSQNQPKYFPLQAQVGDLAVYLRDSAIEVEFNNEKYVIVPYSSILLLFRDEGLLE